MLSLLDAVVAQEDLVPADEPPEEVHHALKKKLRMETRDMALDSTQDAKQEGREFMTHLWPGLPLKQMIQYGPAVALYGVIVGLIAGN
jgi:hypothetical protein